MDLLNTDAEARALGLDRACDDIAYQSRCRAMAKQFSKAFRLLSVTITFPHRRDIVFAAGSDHGSGRILRLKFPRKLEEWAGTPRMQGILPELAQDEADPP